MTLRPEWSGLEANVRIGAAWLLGSEQPADAVGDHLGYGVHVGGGLRISFSASGYVGARHARSGVVVINLSRSDEQYRAGMPEPDPFTDAEVETIGQLLTAAGLDVQDQWNGAGLRTGSFGVRGVSPSLAKSVRNYLAHCPKHDTVFCGGWQAEHIAPRDEPARSDFINCTWHSAGAARMVLPQFVQVAYESVPEPAPTEDDRNLRAVKDALAAITPLLLELDVHAATIVAGARGHIEGDEHLAFVHDGGHGVLLPAEVAVHLVSLAAAAVEAGVVERQQ